MPIWKSIFFILAFAFLPLLCVEMIEGPEGPEEAPQGRQQALMGQQEGLQEEEPSIPDWGRMGPHQIPHCDIPARAEKDPEHVAPCMCPGKVNIVQTLMSEACWAVSGILIPEDPEVRKLIMAFPTAEILECLGEVPDHCEVIAGMYNPRMPRLDKLKEHGYKDEFRCMTMCKPERCGCPDSACKPHGDGRYRYQGADPTDDDGVPYDEYR
jgi:hypothetical protein